LHSTLDVYGASVIHNTLDVTGNLTATGTTNQIGAAGSNNTITGLTNNITGSTSTNITGNNAYLNLSHNDASMGVTGGSTVTATNNQLTAKTADGSGLTVNNGLNATDNPGAAVITLTNSTGHGLTVNTDSTVLTGGTNSSSLTLQDSIATLAVGTASTSEVQVIQATNDGTNTQVTIGGSNNSLNNIQASATNGVNNLTANATSGTNNIEAYTNNIGVATTDSNNNIGNITSTNTITGATNINATAAAEGILTTIGTTANTVTQQALQVNGAMSSTGNATIATAANTNNTFGSGANSNNTIGSGTSTNAINGVTTIDSNGTGVAGGSRIVVSNTQITAQTADGSGLTVNNGLNATANPGAAVITLTNSTGHGLTVNTDSTVLSGGNHSPTSLTLNDSGATFSNNGSPAHVTGVADGVNQYDAVNYGQLQKSYQGIASVSALAAIPGTMPGKRFAIGAGYGYFESQSAVAVGLKASILDCLSVTAGVGLGVGQTDSTYTANAGISFSF
jgi:hypothetical protein